MKSTLSILGSSIVTVLALPFMLGLVIAWFLLPACMKDGLFPV